MVRAHTHIQQGTVQYLTFIDVMTMMIGDSRVLRVIDEDAKTRVRHRCIVVRLRPVVL